MSSEADSRRTVLEFARGYAAEGFSVQDARVFLDERQDGEYVTRVVLVLDDPADDTWRTEAVAQLRHDLGKKATELDLPPVSVTLIPKSEAELIEAVPSQ